MRPSCSSGPSSIRPTVAYPYFTGNGKLTAHEGRAHPFELAVRHSPREHQSLGPAAQRAEKRPHAHLAGSWRCQSFLADFRLSRRDVPERLRNLSGAVGRHDIGSLLDYWYSCCVISSSLHGPSGIRSRNRVLERSPLQSTQADATGNAMAGRRVLFAALMAVTMAGIYCACGAGAVACRFQHNRHHADRVVRDHVALDGGWVLERHNRILDFAFFIGFDRGCDADRRRASAAMSRSLHRQRYCSASATNCLSG